MLMMLSGTWKLNAFTPHHHLLAEQMCCLFGNFGSQALVSHSSLLLHSELTRPSTERNSQNITLHSVFLQYKSRHKQEKHQQLWQYHRDEPLVNSIPTAFSFSPIILKYKSNSNIQSWKMTLISKFQKMPFSETETNFLKPIVMSQGLPSSFMSSLWELVNLLVCFIADPITRKDTVTLMAINTWISSATHE